MEIIGHRGARGLAPENSMEAIRKAVSLKLDMIEIDARLQNGVIVLSHAPIQSNTAYCTLSHALKEVDGKIGINIEIKEHKVVPKLVKLLSTYEGQVVISSFKFNTLREVRRLLPGIEIAVLEKWSAVRAIAEASILKTKRIHLQQQWLWSGVVNSLNNQGYKVYAYTVNEKDRAKDLKQWGISGIFTDYPNRFV